MSMAGVSKVASIVNSVICICVSLSTLNSYKSDFSSTQIIDLDTTSNICCKSSFFEPYKPLCDKFVTLPNGNQIFVQAIGRIFLNDFFVLLRCLIYSHFYCESYFLGKLLFIPHIKFIFDSDRFSIQDTQESKMICGCRGAKNISGALARST